MFPVEHDKGRYRYFGWKLNVGGDFKYHLGHDFDCDLKDTVSSIADGIVIFSDQDVNGFGGISPTRTGGVIIIRHIDKEYKNFIALYGHVKCYVKTGDIVKKGEKIGIVDSYFSGKDDLPHLHFGINICLDIPKYSWGYSKDMGTWTDPRAFIKNRLEG